MGCALCLRSHLLLTVIPRLKEIFHQNGKHSGWHVVRPQKTSATLPVVAISPIFAVRTEAQRAKAGRCSRDSKPDLIDSKFSIFSSKPHLRGSMGCLGLPSQLPSASHVSFGSVTFPELQLSHFLCGLQPGIWAFRAAVFHLYNRGHEAVLILEILQKSETATSSELMLHGW